METKTINWESCAKQLLKDEIKKNLQSYETLAKKLGDTTGNIRNKINRGTFSASFLLKALNALGVKQIDIAYQSNNFEHNTS